QMLIVIIDQDQPVWIGREQDANAALHTTWLEENYIIPYGDHYVQSSERHPMDLICDVLKEKNCDHQTVAVEMDVYNLTAKRYMRAPPGVRNATIIDGTYITTSGRTIMSDSAFSYLHPAASMSETATPVAFDMLEESGRQCDVVAGISHSRTRGTDDFSGGVT